MGLFLFVNPCIRTVWLHFIKIGLIYVPMSDYVYAESIVL